MAELMSQIVAYTGNTRTWTGTGNRNRCEPEPAESDTRFMTVHNEPVWTGTGLWKLKYAQNGRFWRNNDFFMIFLCPKIEKLPKKKKSKKK